MEDNDVTSGVAIMHYSQAHDLQRSIKLLEPVCNQKEVAFSGDTQAYY